MTYCLRCGHPLTTKIPPGDSRERLVCDSCGYIHYENPRLIVGVLPEDDQGRLLLCRRAIEPKRGLWTLPAGFLENGETMADGARREALEEVGARLGPLDLYTIIDIPHIHQVHVFYRGRISKVGPPEGTETLEVGFHTIESLPWSEIAFRSVYYTLEHYALDRQQHLFPLHTTTLGPPTPRGLDHTLTVDPVR